MPDLTPERAQAIVFEIDYWQALLDDLTALNNDVLGTSDDVANGLVALLSLLPMTDERAHATVREGMDAANGALKRLLAMQATIQRILALADGRSKALAEEMPR